MVRGRGAFGRPSQGRGSVPPPAHPDPGCEIVQLVSVASPPRRITASAAAHGSRRSSHEGDRGGGGKLRPSHRHGVENTVTTSPALPIPRPLGKDEVKTPRTTGRPRPSLAHATSHVLCREFSSMGRIGSRTLAMFPFQEQRRPRPGTARRVSVDIARYFNQGRNAGPVRADVLTPLVEHS